MASKTPAVSACAAEACLLARARVVRGRVTQPSRSASSRPRERKCKEQAHGADSRATKSIVSTAPVSPRTERRTDPVAPHVLASGDSRGTLGAKQIKIKGSLRLRRASPEMVGSASPRAPTRPPVTRGPSGVATAGRGRILERGARARPGRLLALFWPHGPVHATCLIIPPACCAACAPVSPTQPRRVHD